MLCQQPLVHGLSCAIVLAALLLLLRQRRAGARYGRYVDPGLRRTCPARVAWFAQELPALLVPLLLLWSSASPPSSAGTTLLLCTFCLHYFHRTFIYALLTRGRPCPVHIVVCSVIFCSINGFLQGHYLLHCAHFQHTWLTNFRIAAGLLLFYLGMAINIHSDVILRNLRRPGEVVYRIPRGGMFEYVSGANLFGEILEWLGYAVATWSLASFSFTFFTMCSIGPRAYHHHRDYLHKFKDYPRSRKAVIPFLL
ncbi:3-oxo-5-alpha-steroid 4-dehydrogenase 2a [Lampris incognitus]|uniref:3-oxo-5-alpha-steroid 4-dehydrogenase 2a n=1 Tax=Lampris incognitus TaxID=2546036 RepID=UPI0024B533DE|nr:3-oxo-5-alpha-steroid 4-dehydrogenase 2a [Lampris incognitus]